MTDRYNFFSFLAVVVAIVGLAIIAAYKGTQTDLAIMTGLIGVLGTFRPGRSAANVEQANTVNQIPQAQETVS